MKTELIQILSTDNLRLPALLYKPSKKTNKVAIYLHGMFGSVFYSVKRTNTIAKHLNKEGIAFFALNNRGAHSIQRLRKKINENEDEKVFQGATNELIKDCIFDIEGALKYLKTLGHEEFYLIGHSTGANKVCVYNFYKQRNSFKKFVLLGGGDDTGLYIEDVGLKFFRKAIRKTKRALKNENHTKLVAKYLGAGLLSYQSFFDVINPDGDYNTFPFFEYQRKISLSKKKLFRELKTIKKPTLILYGENDEYMRPNSEAIIRILKRQTRGRSNFYYKLLEDADHGFEGKENELGKSIVDFLS